ncbi:MAG: four helix bundle protein [Candidatus Peribacteraceae bacterium]|nr:four helix bundle protein [Candidatus Peribacteraceae bacterium]
MLKMSYKDLRVWVKGRALVKIVYQLTKAFPKEELFGLTSQIRRAAVSIPSNIAEGSQRSSDREFANYVLIARGSIAELETQVLLSVDIGYLSNEHATPVLQLLDEISRMLHRLHSKLIAQSS